VIGIDVPENYQSEFEKCIVTTIGPPAGVSREHCIEAKVLVTMDWAEEDGMGPAWVMFYKPEEDDLKVLNSGGSVKLTLRAIDGLIPHSLGVWQ
jgi:hypothetical protein